MQTIPAARAKNALSHYLSQHAEPIVEQIRRITPQVPRHLEHCLVIPCYNENSDFIQRLHSSQLAQQHLLLIIVVNQPTNDKNDANNKALWEIIKTTGNVVYNNKTIQVVEWYNSNATCISIDCFSETHRLNSKQAVGLARKLGCDIAILK